MSGLICGFPLSARDPNGVACVLAEGHAGQHAHRCCPYCGGAYNDGRTHGRVFEDGPILCEAL